MAAPLLESSSAAPPGGRMMLSQPYMWIDFDFLPPLMSTSAKPCGLDCLHRCDLAYLAPQHDKKRQHQGEDR